MPLVSMTEMLNKAKAEHYAVGAFNIVDYVTLQAVVDAAEEERSPAIIQTSASSTVKYYGYKQLVDMVANLTEKSDIPFALHLDHCKDLDMVFACIDSGWTSVMYDGSSYAFEVNLEDSKKVVAKARAKGVSVEGEIGAVWGVEEDIDVDEHPDLLADPDKAVLYAQETGVDAFAPAELAKRHSLYVTRPILFDFIDTRGRLLTACDELFDVIASGAVIVSVNQKYALKNAAQAHIDLEARKTTGSTILTP